MASIQMNASTTPNLRAVEATEVTDPMAAMRAEVERLKAENEKLKANKGSTAGIKVSEKGGVSVYGLGRFPVTLYRSQWEKLLNMADDIRAFIEANKAALKEKPAKE